MCFAHRRAVIIQVGGPFGLGGSKMVSIFPAVCRVSFSGATVAGRCGRRDLWG